MKKIPTFLGILSVVLLYSFPMAMITRATESIANLPGIKYDAIVRLVYEAGKAHSDALVVMKDGRVVGEWYFNNTPGLIEAMSVTKSVVALAIGKLITDHKIESVDEPVWHYFPEWRQGQKEKVTIKHLLSHSSGIQCSAGTEELYRCPDFVKLALAAELSEVPGEKFRYNNKAANLLPAIIEKASGQKADDYFKEALFAKIGIKDFSWAHDSSGNPHGMSGLQISALDLAKIGQLMLNEGSWNGEQLIDKSFIREAVDPNPKLASGCGYLWWSSYAWRKFKIEQRTFNEWKKLGVGEEFIPKLEELKGKELTIAEIKHAIDDACGADTFQKMCQAGNPFMGATASCGPRIGFNANGWLGQFLIVLPKEHLVAVRQIKAEHHKTEADDLADFPNLVYNLVKQ
jgi:CubicO group peptidase (beta-lactamase class C family)